MRSANMFLGALGVERAVMEDCIFEPQPSGQQAYVVRGRPTKKEQGRCAVCSRRCPGYDRGDEVRRWRAMDLGMCMTWVEGHREGTDYQLGEAEMKGARDERTPLTSAMDQKLGTSAAELSWSTDGKYRPNRMQPATSSVQRGAWYWDTASSRRLALLHTLRDRPRCDDAAAAGTWSRAAATSVRPWLA